MLNQKQGKVQGSRESMKLWIVNVRLSEIAPSGLQKNEGSDGIWIVKCEDGLVSEVSRGQLDPNEQNVLITQGIHTLDAKGSLMLPSLCHSHIHIDKCFILDRCGDLLIGDFKEAMEVTAEAKSKFAMDPDDLYLRGARLIEESVENGITSMRAHVEVDSIVGFSCLDTALKLKYKYKNICDVQIAVFAQEPLFQDASNTEPGYNYTLICQAARRDGVSAIGSAPYVEPTMEHAKKNITLIFDLATVIAAELEMPSQIPVHHIDFHLDYNLNPSAEPLIYEVITQAKLYYPRWGIDYENVRTEDMDVPLPSSFRFDKFLPRITVGHATRLQLFSHDEWRALRAAIGKLPIVLVGLPQSDMYMQGRPHANEPLGPPRSTLRVPLIEREYGLKVAMAVNNVENAFTPQGSLDPLSSLVSFGVAVFQAATPRDIRSLLEAVTLTSKIAIGVTRTVSSEDEPKGADDRAQEYSDGHSKGKLMLERVPADLFPTPGDPADFVILHGNKSLRSVAFCPAFERTTVKAGKVVARRGKWRWVSGITVGGDEKVLTA